ncbi:MAG: hypothetical protein K4571_05855 [Deltaproteobacteria bacterium]
MKRILLCLVYVFFLLGFNLSAYAADDATKPQAVKTVSGAAAGTARDAKDETVKIYRESKDAVVRDIKAMKEDIPKGLKEAKDSTAQQSREIKEGAAKEFKELKDNVSNPTSAPKSRKN